MVMSILERTREIGIMRPSAAATPTPPDLPGEASAIGLLGGLAG